MGLEKFGRIHKSTRYTLVKMAVRMGEPSSLQQFLPNPMQGERQA